MSQPQQQTSAVATPRVGWARDIRAVAEDLSQRFAALPDDSWDRTATDLEWTCRETAAHLLDDQLGYALQVSGAHGTGEGYAPLAEAPYGRPEGPAFWLWPEPAGGSAAIATSLDAVSGVFAAVVETCPPDRIGWHPWGSTDATGFAAMGLAETTLHAWDVLRTVGEDWAPDAAVAGRVLDRIFPGAERTADPWHDLLATTGRTDETRGRPWRWDARVRRAGA